MHVVLINPPNLGEAERHWSRLHLGLGYVAASLSASGRRVSVIDAKLEDLDLDETVRRAVAAGPDLIGITTMTVEFPLVVEMAGRIKARWKAPIIVGGAHCNAVGAGVLLECGDIDYCCPCEGERLIVELTESLEGDGECDGVAGLIHRVDGKVAVNSPRPNVTEIDALPFPAWDLFPATSCVPLLTYRGCPFHCVFCSHNSGREARYRSVENVLSELEQIITRYRPAVISFADETFGLHRDRTKELLREIVRRGFHLRTYFCAQSRVDCVDQEVMLLMKAANVGTLEFGVESGNEKVLKRIRKGISLPQVESAVELAHALGISVICKFILGHPHETKKNIQDTIRFISRLNPEGISVSIMTPYPGTPVHAMAARGRGGYRLATDDWKMFDKYSGMGLEFEHFTLTYLKWAQIRCYLRLYLANWRIGDLLRLAWSQRVLVARIVHGFFTQVRVDASARAERSSREAAVADPAC